MGVLRRILGVRLGWVRAPRHGQHAQAHQRRKGCQRPIGAAIAARHPHHLGHQEWGKESSQAEEEMQAVHERRNFFTVRPDQQGVCPGVDKTLGETFANQYCQQHP